MYATIERARAAGALGTDAQVTDALAEARALIDGFTGAWWEPTAATLVARVDHDGLCLLPYVVQAVTLVETLEHTAFPATGYRVLSSATPGQIDAVQLGAGLSWADPLVVGAEPWSGGWPNLFGPVLDGQVAITGTFGASPTPPAVADAAAALAAWRTTGGVLTPVPLTTPQTDDEGNTVSVTLEVAAVVTTAPTTGVPAIDAVLAPYVRRGVRVN